MEMTNMRFKKATIAIILFSILYFSLSYLARPTGSVLNKDWYLTFDDVTQKVELPYYEFPKESGLSTFKTSFDKPEGDTLVIPKISCYAYKVYINDTLVSQIGDFRNPTSNIWNYARVISLDKNILKDRNELIIKAYLLDDVGMHIPPFIDKKENIMLRISTFNFINNDIHSIMLGMSISVAFMMIAISIYNQAQKTMYLCLGLSAILGAVYSFDCVYRLYSGDIYTFLFIRKILFSSCYLAGAFMIRGIEKYTGITLKIRKLIFFSIGLAVFLVMASGDFIVLRSRINILNVVMIVAPIYSIILLSKDKITQFFFSICFLILILGYTVLSVLFKAHSPYLFPYGIIMYSTGLSFAIILEFTKIYNEKNRIYEKSVTDHLTSAYNRNILEDINMNLDDIIVLIDIDNLKYYNDTFGHIQGDMLLVDVVDIIKNHIRKNDFIIRLGGDEFLIIFKDTNESMAEKIILRIREEFKDKISNEKIDISFGILRYHKDFESSYNQADRIMYEMKADKKYKE